MVPQPEEYFRAGWPIFPSRAALAWLSPLLIFQDLRCTRMALENKSAPLSALIKPAVGRPEAFDTRSLVKRCSVGPRTRCLRDYHYLITSEQ